MHIAEFHLALNAEWRYYDLLVPTGAQILDAELRLMAGTQQPCIDVFVSTENSATYEVRRLALLEVEDAMPHGWTDVARFEDKLLVMKKEPLPSECVFSEGSRSLCVAMVANGSPCEAHCTEIALKAPDQCLETFSYTVAHGLRGPLRAVDGFTRLLELNHVDQLDNDARRCIRIVRENSSRMNRLIDELLAFARLGYQRINMAVVNMHDSVRRALDEVLASRTNASPDIIVGALPDAYADPALLHYVWTNLIDNAIKYSSKAKAPRIEIGAVVVGGEARYFVQDNGAGFDMRYASKLFEVFQRLHDSREFPGTGVGLAIVRQLVSRVGGRVWATSEPGKGACFFVALPLAGGSDPS